MSKLVIPGVVAQSGNGGGGGGSSNYNDLSNKPSINDVVLSGNKTAENLGLVSTTGESTINGSLTVETDEDNGYIFGDYVEATEMSTSSIEFDSSRIYDEFDENTGDKSLVLNTINGSVVAIENDADNATAAPTIVRKGKDITGEEAVVWTSDLTPYLKNIATGTSSLQIGGTSANQYNFVTLIGRGANATNSSCIAISSGNSTASAAAGSIAIGNAVGAAANTIVISPNNIGYASAIGAIQLGGGTNTTANSLQVYDYQLLDGTTGKIPVERLPDISGSGSAPVEKDFSNITGTTLATGLTLSGFQIISVYKNGVLLTETSQTNPNQDYIISENNLIFTTALVASDKVKLIGYAKLDGASALSEISYTELNASGFDGTSGLQLASAPFSGIQSSDNWELVVCLTPDIITGSGDAANNLLYSRYPDSSKMSTDFLAIGSSQRMRIYLSSNGTSNDIANAVDTNCYLVAGKKQWIKLAYTSGTYTIDQSFDGDTYANKWTLTNAAQIYNGADAITAFGIHATVSALRMHGILHLDETYISINGTKVFEGSDSSDYIVVGDGLTIGETINKELILTPSNIPGYNPNVTQYLKHVNNETQWAEVEPIKTLTTSSTELENNCVYNGGELASVTVTLPSTVPVNFCCKVQFSSGTTATVFSGSGIYFEGDACSDGTFTPIASHRYSIMITNDGVNTIGFVYQK